MLFDFNLRTTTCYARQSKKPTDKVGVLPNIVNVCFFAYSCLEMCETWKNIIFKHMMFFSLCLSGFHYYENLRTKGRRKFIRILKCLFSKQRSDLIFDFLDSELRVENTENQKKN